MRIGEAAARAGVSRDTLRYYERHGLLPRAARGANGYRDYPASIVTRVTIVRSALRFGFTVRQIAGFFHARDAGRPPCREVRRAAGELAREMDRRIAELVEVRAALAATLEQWDERLAATPPGTPAKLLESLSPRSA